MAISAISDTLRMPRMKVASVVSRSPSESAALDAVDEAWSDLELEASDRQDGPVIELGPELELSSLEELTHEL